MGMPFNTIFAIILIIIFFVVAFFTIKYFLGIKACGEIGMFTDNLNSDIEKTWASQKSVSVFSGTLPLEIKKVCFADRSKNADNNKEIFDEFKLVSGDYNMFFYPTKNSCDVQGYKLNNIHFEKNPLCFENTGGNVKIKIEKGFYDNFVNISKTE